MFLDRLAHMQPLFLVAMVLCWSAVGAVVNDVSADIAAKAMTPKEAAQAVQQAWQLAN